MSATSLNARPHPAAVDVAVADSTTYVHGVFDVHRWGSVCLTALADEALDIRAEWSMDGAEYGTAGDLDSLTNITTLVANQPANWVLTPRARYMRVCAENATGNAATLSLDVFLHEAPAPSQQLPLDADEDSVEARLRLFNGADWVDARGSSDGRLAVLAGHDGASSRALATDGDGRLAADARCSGFDGGSWKPMLTDGDGRVATRARLVGYDADMDTWRSVAVDSDGKLVVAAQATTPASFAYSGTASSTAVAVATPGGDLLSLVVSNSDNVPVYIWLYDDDGAGVDEFTVPDAGFAVAAGGSFSLSLPADHPWRFTDGAVFRATTGATYTDTNSPTGGSVHITVAYV